jgi:hypothetical protein
MDPSAHSLVLVHHCNGLRSTFDRLPYGCLLFMYRLKTENFARKFALALFPNL